MDGGDRLNDLTFRVNLTGYGAARLRDQVKEKLKEYMGDYTDDTLVEYVIVLLKNGRRKEEARNELNVFLGDDGDSFVTWLWDHLQSNVDVYVKDEVPKPRTLSGDQSGRSDARRLNPEQETEKSNKLSKSRSGKDWKGVVRDVDEPPTIRSAVIANINTEDGSHHGKRSPSPRPLGQKKRRQPDDRAQVEEAASKARVSAPRRLLQFAVRDAVATSRPSTATDPPFKRLRSVVSGSAEEFIRADQTQRLRSVAKVPNAMAVAIKAVTEAAKDVTKVNSSRNVFDRLGPDIFDANEPLKDYEEDSVEDDEEYGAFTQISEEPKSSYHQRNDYTGHVSNLSAVENDVGMASDFASDDEGYDDVGAMDHGKVEVSETCIPCVPNDAVEFGHKVWKDHDLPVSLANASSKAVNISVNVNSRKPSRYQEPEEKLEISNRTLVKESVKGVEEAGLRLVKGNGSLVKLIPPTVVQKDSQKTLASTGVYSTGRPMEDADSRTIFVSNVHFGATKDSISRHFNKFGEVLKVVMLTDAATGQPKGSAYVEFMRKVAAEHALSLNGTSFMSRILKVVKKGLAHQEGSLPVAGWPRVNRASPFSASRFPRIPFPRAVPSMYRPRPAIKPRARSLQWKRDVQSTAPDGGSLLPSPAARSFTYVRPEPKTVGMPTRPS